MNNSPLCVPTVKRPFSMVAIGFLFAVNGLALNGCNKASKSTDTQHEVKMATQQATADIGSANAATATAQAPTTETTAETATGTAIPDSTDTTARIPTVLIGNQASALEQQRQLIKTSSVDFDVADVQKATQEIEKRLLAVNGYIEGKQSEYRVTDQERRVMADGSIKLFEKVIPTTQMTVRLPVNQVTVFINQLLPLMKNFNRQDYEAKRYELKLLEEKISTAQQGEGSSRSTNAALQRLTEQEVQDRLRYSTVTLTYQQDAILRQKQDIDLNRVAAQNGEGFWSRIGQALRYGFIGLREAVIGLVMLWPLYIVLLVGYFIVRKIRQKIVQRKHKSTNQSVN